MKRVKNRLIIVLFIHLTQQLFSGYCPTTTLAWRNTLSLSV